MTITANDQYVHPPRISRDRFAQIIRERANPGLIAERDPGAYWDSIQSFGVDPLFVLAMFNHESSMGKAGVAVTSHSWGNTRAPSFGATPVGTVPGRTGTFPVWRDWLDGCKSTAARLVEPTWVYAGRTSIREIFDHPSGQVWAPAGDLNDPAGYLRAMLDFMNQHADQEAAMAGDDPRFAWVPDSREFGYPQGTRGRNGRAVDYLIIHVTEGTNSLGWLTGNNGSSAHYLTNRDATPRAQMVREADAAWTAGSRDYNERGINVEFERFARDPWTDAEYRNAAATCYPIMARHSIPIVALGRNHASRRGIIGHEHVPDPDGSGWGGAGNHTDPGPQFDWTRFVAELRKLETAPPTPEPDPDVLHFPETGFSISGGFRAYWEQFGGLPVYGYPITSEYEENGVRVQWFERARFEWHPGSWPERYDVLVGLVGVELLAARERIEELEETG